MKNKPKPFLRVESKNDFFIVLDEDDRLYNVSSTFRRAKMAIPGIARRLKKDKYRRKKRLSRINS